MWIAINRNRRVDASCTDVDSGGVLPVHEFGMDRWHRRLALFGHSTTPKRKSTGRIGPVVQLEAPLLNGFDRTPFAGGLIACRPEDLHYPIKDEVEHPAQTKFLSALPRHEPGWMLLTEDLGN